MYYKNIPTKKKVIKSKPSPLFKQQKEVEEKDKNIKLTEEKNNETNPTTDTNMFYNKFADDVKFWFTYSFIILSVISIPNFSFISLVKLI